MKEKIRKILEKMTGSNDYRGCLWDSDLQFDKDLGFVTIAESRFDQATQAILDLLPSDEEILNLLPPQSSTPFNMKAYAKAISKRIRGNNEKKI